MAAEVQVRERAEAREVLAGGVGEAEGAGEVQRGESGAQLGQRRQAPNWAVGKRLQRASAGEREVAERRAACRLRRRVVVVVVVGRKFGPVAKVQALLADIEGDQAGQGQDEVEIIATQFASLVPLEEGYPLRCKPSWYRIFETYPCQENFLQLRARSRKTRNFTDADPTYV